MIPANVYQAELFSAIGRPRQAVMRLGLALLLGLPFVLAGMPDRVRASGLVMLVVFTAFFGAAVSHARARSDGRITELLLLPLPRWKMFLDRVLAGAVVDIFQNAPLMILFMLLHAGKASWSGWVLLGVWFSVTVLILNLLGSALGALMRGNAEVHLAGALAVGLLAFFSGIFPAPPVLHPIVGAASSVSPLAHLNGLLLRLAEGQSLLFGSGSLPPLAVALAAAALVIQRCSGMGRGPLNG